MSLEENKENLLSLHLHHFTRKNKPLSPFISKLRFLLNCSKHHDAIHWSADGRSIVITDITTFKKSVLENEEEMFKTRNFASFVRQLNLYGFRKVPSNGKSDPTSNMKFEHTHFRRERPDLMQLVHRTCLSGRRRNDSLTVRNSQLSEHPPPLLPKNITPVLYIKQECSHNETKKPFNISILQNLKATTGPSSATINSLCTSPIVHNIHQNVIAAKTFVKATNATQNNTTKIVSLKQVLCNKKNVKTTRSVAVTSKVLPGVSTKTLLPKDHNYALPSTPKQQHNDSPISPITEMDDEQVYQFLDHNFMAEKDAIQTLLSLPDYDHHHQQYQSQQLVVDQQFQDLRTLAEVSLNDFDDVQLHSRGNATPCQTTHFTVKR